MNAFASYLAALHQQDLLEQAQLYRRAKLATASKPSTPAWRRTLGGRSRSAARRLDPTVEVDAPFGGPSGRPRLPTCCRPAKRGLIS